ncbi:uncharacterized protein LOC120347059 [Styela clava]
MADNMDEDDLVVPYKKLRKEKAGIEGEDFGIQPNLSSHFSNGLGDSKYKSGESAPGRHLRFHSVEQDDVQSSSGNSSNIENENPNDEDSGNISDSSSHASSGDWQRRPAGMIGWVHAQMLSGVDPREILHHLVPSLSSSLPVDINPFTLWKLVLNILSEPQRRPKLSHINSLSDVVNLIKNAKNILVLTGAGVSVSCGIPDFRSRDGIYARLAVDFPDLPDPQAMFDISYFTQDPRPFFKFAKEIYPGQFKPSRSHRFISLLQKTERLLRNYTQNIDTLEQVSGISKVIQCHGSFATASCLKCHYKVDCEVVREDIFNMKVPRCPKCPPDEELSIMKPDIVFFGESLPEHFHRQMSKDKHDTDLLIVIGSSLKVRPVALIPSSLPDHVPQILINREPLPHVQFDVELLGDGDTIVAEICRRLGSEFLDIAEERDPLVEIDVLPDESSPSSSQQTSTKTSNSEENDLSQEDTKQNTDSITSTSESQAILTGDKNNISSSDSEKVSSATDVTPCQTNTDNEDSQSSSNVQNKPSSSANVNVTDGKNISSLQQSNDSKLVESGDKLHATESNDEKQTNEKEKTEKIFNNMWKSRWKQSISKRLPVGSFYYDGKYRYIFPGAEVSPEEVDDDDDSDTSDISDDEVGENNQDQSSSSDESEEDIKGPGGLSSTRRDLRTSSMKSGHHHHFHGLSSFVHDHDVVMMNHSKDCCSDKESSCVKGNSSHKTSEPTQNTTTSTDSKSHFEPIKEESDSIIPDELHEDIITLSTTSHSSHSPLPENLHKLFSSDHLHNEKDDAILIKPILEVPDTAQILDLPSSSLLPPIDDKYSISNQDSVSAEEKSNDNQTS